MMPNPYLFFFPVVFSRQFHFLVSRHRPDLYKLTGSLLHMQAWKRYPLIPAAGEAVAKAGEMDLFFISGRQQTGCDTYTG